MVSQLEEEKLAENGINLFKYSFKESTISSAYSTF
jgi:hypothetical protein